MERTLRVVYIVPSHYDDEGYVHRYWRGVVPSNSVLCLRTLTRNVGQTQELGPDVAVEVEIYDDNVERPPLNKLIRRQKRGKETLLVGFVGVQSNQFARAADMALELRRGGVPVMMGGFHVSGMLAMFDEPTPDLVPLLEAGVTLVRGEMETPGVLAGILQDALEGTLKPIYENLDPPDLRDAPVPEPETKYLNKFLLKHLSTMDTSRGCPFRCSFCTIINVQGTKMRCRSAEKIIETVRANWDAGIQTYFFTDDNMSRSRVWEDVFRGLIQLREEGMPVKFMMQVDTQAYLLPDFVDLASKAGCHTVFVGMETVNPDNISATGKTQNKADTYPEMVEAWHDAGIRVHVGYIIGLPHDTSDSVALDVLTLRDHIKVDEASFFMLTPLPGSADHKNMVEGCVPLDADLNNYDSNHETFLHANFAPGKWEKSFRDAWETFYSKESVTHILMRAPRSEYWGLFWTTLWYRWSTVFCHQHPMSTGLFRFKSRTERRPTFPQEGRLRYAWRRLKDLWWGTKVYAQLYWEWHEIWLLTRKPDDPRWSTLAELRTRWASMQQRIAMKTFSGRVDDAAHEVRAMLKAASERLHAMSKQPQIIGRRGSDVLRAKAHQVEDYLRSFELEMPSHDAIVKAQAYIGKQLVAGYEEVAIRYVAKRRRFNDLRKDMLRKLKQGRLFDINPLTLTRVALAEMWFALRFTFQVVRNGV